MAPTCDRPGAMSILPGMTISQAGLSFLPHQRRPPMRLTRRTALSAGIAMATRPALAQDKPLRIVLGVPPGASADTITRVVAEKMGKALGRTVVVENKTGAGGIVANMAVKQAAPDGNTLLMTPLATMVAFPHSY